MTFLTQTPSDPDRPLQSGMGLAMMSWIGDPARPEIHGAEAPNGGQVA